MIKISKHDYARDLTLQYNAWQAWRTIMYEPGRGIICGKGTTYGAIDDLGGPSMVAILGPGGPSMARKLPQMVQGYQFWGITDQWHDSTSQ